MVCGREWGKSKAQRSNKIGADFKENHIYFPKIFFDIFFSHNRSLSYPFIKILSILEYRDKIKVLPTLLSLSVT